MKSVVANGGLEAMGWLRGGPGCLRGGPGLPERCLWANRKESLPAPLCPWQPRNNNLSLLHFRPRTGEQWKSKTHQDIQKKVMEMWNAKRQSGRKFHPTRPVQREVYSTPTTPYPQDARPRSGSWDFWRSRNRQSSPWLHSTGPQWWPPPLGN